MHITKKGYTLVELLIVIVVIGILTTLTFFTFGRVQSDTRDKERLTNAVILSEALEKYYEKHGEYPSVVSVTSTDISSVKAKLGLTDADVLVMPKAPNGTTTSITANESDINKLAYNGESVNPSESEQCISDLNGGCDQFRLEWVDEQGQPQQIESRHEGRDVAGTLSPPTDPTITIGYNGSVIRATAATSVCAAGTLQYKMAINSTGADPDWTLFSWQTITTKDQAAPVSGTTYYGFVIARCISGAIGVAENPNVAQDSHYYAAAGTPVMVASWSGTSAVGTATFAPACGAGLTAKYYIEYRIDTTAATGSWDIGQNWTTTNSYSIAGADTSNPRKFNFRATVRCDNGGTPGAPSAISNTDFVISAPIAPAVTDNSTSTTTTWTWPAAPCPVGSSPVYRGTWTGNYNAYPAMTSTITSGKNMTSTSQGFIYGLRVSTSCGTVSAKILSVNSADSTYSRPIDQAPFYVARGGIRLYRPSGGGATTNYAQARAVTVHGSTACPAGLDRYIQFNPDINDGTGSIDSGDNPAGTDLGWVGGRIWPTGVYQDYYFTYDLDDTDRVEIYARAFCYNDITDTLGPAPTTHDDRWGNIHVRASDGDYNANCDQPASGSFGPKNPGWCQVGRNEADTANGSTCQDGNQTYCWVTYRTIGSWTWPTFGTSGYPNSYESRPASSWGMVE